MFTLLEIQTGFADAIRDRSRELPEDLILMDGMPVQTRLDVYRNNVFASLQDLLSERFPAVSRVVHEQFFWYAADTFIRNHLPEKPVLSVYGAEFPGFLADFPPCQPLVYLPDLARLEWLIFSAATAPIRPPLDRGSLSAFSPEALGDLRFGLEPSLGLLASHWPVERIWRANRSGADEKAADLSQGGAFLEVRRVQGDVGFRRLPAGVFAFRSMLQGGKTLEDAADAAQTADAHFDLAAAMSDLIHEGVVVEVSAITGEPRKGE